jgi:hypothetical protein
MDPLLESLAKHHQLRHIKIISLDLETYKYGPKNIPLNGIITLISSITNDSENSENLKPVNVLFAEALYLLCFTGTLRCLSIVELLKAEEPVLWPVLKTHYGHNL